MDSFKLAVPLCDDYWPSCCSRYYPLCLEVLVKQCLVVRVGRHYKPILPTSSLHLWKILIALSKRTVQITCTVVRNSALRFHSHIFVIYATSPVTKSSNYVKKNSMFLTIPITTWLTVLTFLISKQMQSVSRDLCSKLLSPSLQNACKRIAQHSYNIWHVVDFNIYFLIFNKIMPKIIFQQFF